MIDMKNCYLLLCLIAGAPVFAQLPFDQTALLREHMVEVNSEWTLHAEALGENAPVSFGSEAERIQCHLNLVIKDLRQAHDCASENPGQVCLLMDQLQKYADAGDFPVNLHQPVRIPHFIDHKGTACAVGHLMLENGFEETAWSVHDQMNLAYVREIPQSALMPWMEASELSIAEMAWIQPGYPPTNSWTDHGENVTGLITDIVVWNDELYVSGVFQLDGEEHTLAKLAGDVLVPAAINPSGQINDLEVYQGDLVACGTFVANTNFFRFTGDDIFYETVGLSKGPYGYKLLADGDDLYFSADASGFVEQYAIHHWDGSEWTNLCNTDLVARDLVVHDGDLVIAGYFSQIVSPEFLEVNRAARWDGSNWSAMGDGLPNTVFGLESADGVLMACGEFYNGADELVFGTAHWEADNWVVHQWGTLLTSTPGEPYALYGVEYIAGHWYAHGYGSWGSDLIYGDGIGQLFVSGGEVIGINAMMATPVSGVIRSVELFDGKIFAGGDFFQEDYLWSNLVSTEIPSDVPAFEAPGFSAFPNPVLEELTLDLTAFSGIVDIEVRDASGRLVGNERLEGGQMSIIDASEWASGSYSIRASQSGANARVVRVVKE